MQRNFWRGLIAGSFLGAMMSMMRNTKRKPSKILNMDNIMRNNSQRKTNRMIKEVSRTVNGLMKKK